MRRYANRFKGVALLGALTLVAPFAASAQPIRHEIIDQVTVAGDAHCARVKIELAVPFVVVGHLPDKATRYFYLFVKASGGVGVSGAALQQRESAAYPRKAAPWLENVSYIGDIPGVQMLAVEVSEPRLVQPLPQREARAVAVMIANPDNEQACRAAVDNNSQP